MTRQQVQSLATSRLSFSTAWVDWSMLKGWPAFACGAELAERLEELRRDRVGVEDQECGGG